MRSLFLLAFPLLFLGLPFASAWYVAGRLRRAFGWRARWRARLAVTVVLVGAMVATFGGAVPAARAVGIAYVAGGLVFLTYIYLLLTLLAVHLVTAVRSLPPRVVRSAIVLLPAIATVAGVGGASRFAVRETVIPVRGLAHDVVVMHVSDVHLGHHRGREYLVRVVETINAHHPDVVVITGDLVDSKAALAPGVLDPLAALAAPAYLVEGNHEKYVGSPRALDAIARQGVRVLRNEAVMIHGLRIVGLNYMNADEHSADLHPSDDERTIKSVMATFPVDDSLPTVALHHSPIGIPYLAAAGVDLLLSGHTHGGQVFPGTLLAAWIYRYNAGLYEEGSLRIFVSRGVGTYMVAARLGTANELDLLRLKGH
ncbi:MAG: metallophosphoesterase [Acidobacteria bacterium]|nr:metallophosphoesterase [Acidobacteriota bacterium]